MNLIDQKHQTLLHTLIKHMHVHALVHARARTHTHTHTRTNAHTHTFTHCHHTHTRTHAHARTHAHTHTHTHTYRYTGLGSKPQQRTSDVTVEAECIPDSFAGTSMGSLPVGNVAAENHTSMFCTLVDVLLVQGRGKLLFC